MLIRVALLFACSAGALYVFLSCFSQINRKAWTVFIKTASKVLFCLVFGALVVTAVGIFSQLTN